MREEQEGEIPFSISGKDKKAVREELAQLERRYPKLDLRAAMGTLRETVEYIDERVDLHLGVAGPETFRAVLKIALNFFVYSGGSRLHTDRWIREIREKVFGQSCGWYRGPDPTGRPESEKIAHVLMLRADPKTGSVWSYVELFGVLRFLARAPGAYSGPEVVSTYGYDLLSCKEFTVSAFELRENSLQIHQEPDPEQMKLGLAQIVAAAERWSTETHVEDMVDAAFKECVTARGEGSAEELWSILWKRLEPYLVSRVRAQNRLLREAEERRLRKGPSDR